ncbi:MAG TPA: COX15/CtaA family protein [Thermoplasmata archaeon]|nr:COX15/CtaA family protein [Thermoplasmata archaeon]
MGSAPRGHDLFRYLVLAAVVACYATLLLGGNVMASDSGLACPDWPTCHGTFAPPLSGSTGIEWAHRLSALVLSLTVGLMTVTALRTEAARPVLRRLSLLALGTVGVQGLLGGAVVASNLTVAVVLLHFGLATILFGLLLLLAFLANLREIPRRWVAWAWRAIEDRPGTEASERPFRSEAPPTPAPTSETGA